MTGTPGYGARWSDANTLGNAVIYDNGTNVGIGSTVPQAKLDIEGSVYVGNGNIGVGSSAPAQKLDIAGNIYVNGNIGVGSSAPSQKIDVVGTVRATVLQGLIVPRITAIASSATPTPDAGTTDLYQVTALAAGATFGSPTGTPVDGQKMMIRILDNGTARALAWNAIYRAVGTVLPTTTVISKTLYVGIIYNSASAKWDVLAVGQE
jgi:hypothetical protein